MAGHPVFHEATVYFTVEYVNSLPKKLSEYKDVIRTSFKLTLVEGAETGGYACTGALKHLTAFADDFPKYVREEQKRAIESILGEGSNNMNNGENDNMVTMFCPICKFTTNDVPNFRKHIRNCKSDLNEELIKFLCTLCDQKHFETQNLSVYIRHLKTIHSKRKEVLCDQCGVSFNRKDALRSHKNAVHGSGVKKPYVCELCGKAFRCNSHLVTHYQKHSDAKDVECGQCSVKFKTEASRNKHVIYKHANPKPFKCDICQRGFSTKQNLKTHLSIHEREKESYDAEEEVRAISQQIAAHIQAQYEKQVTGEEPMEETGQHQELPTTNLQSMSTDSTASPAQSEMLPTFTDQSPSVALPEPIPSQPQQEVVPSPRVLPSPVIYQSAPDSVTSQFTGYSTEPMSHHQDDNHADLDEIFPEPPREEEANIMEEEPGYDSNQDELDSVFAAAEVSSETHTPQISRPPSGGSQHPDTVSNRALDALLQLRPTLNTQESSPSQSVCSGSQFTTPHQSRPPSVGSQHSSFHDTHHPSHGTDTSPAVANPGLHYDCAVTGYFRQPEPEIFAQPMTCSNPTMTPAQMQSYSTMYNDTNTNTTMYHDQSAGNPAMYQRGHEDRPPQMNQIPPMYTHDEARNPELFADNNPNTMFSSDSSSHHHPLITNDASADSHLMTETTISHDAPMFNNTNGNSHHRVPSQAEVTRQSMQTPVNPIASSTDVVMPIPQSVKYVTEQIDTGKAMGFPNLASSASTYDPASVSSFTDTFATPHYTSTGNQECVVCDSGRCLSPNTFAVNNLSQPDQVSGMGSRSQGPSFASPLPHSAGIVTPDTLIIPDNAHLTTTELHTPIKNFPPNQPVVPGLPDSILDYPNNRNMDQSNNM